MAEEIQEAVQIIKVMFDGIGMAIKVGSGGINAVKDCVSFIGGMLEHEKMSGKTSMKELLKRGGDMQVLRFKDEDMKMVAKLAKKYGILYAEIPKAGRDTGMSEIVFHTEAVPRVNMLLTKIKSGSILNYDEYLARKDENQVDKLLDALRKMASKGKDDGLSAEQASKVQDMEEQAQAVSLAKDNGLRDVTMNKSLIADENDLAVKVRVPKTWGNDVRHIWVDRKDIVDIHNGKSMLVYLDKEKKYDMYGKDGKIAASLEGKELLKHYDKVDESLRQKAGMPESAKMSADKTPIVENVMKSSKGGR